MSCPELPSETSIQEADDQLCRLNQQKQAWLTMPMDTRLKYLAHCLDNVAAVSEHWVAAACHGKGLDPSAPIAGEEWLTGPFAIMRYLRLLMRTLSGQARPLPKRRSPSTQPQGLEQEAGQETGQEVVQEVVQIFPQDLFDRLLLLGTTAQVWSLPGKTIVQGVSERKTAEVALVLGAGNISAIGPLDALHQLFVEQRVVVLKMNPVNAAVGPWIAQAFAQLIAEGFMTIAYGGADLGSYLCQHPGVDAVHITGAQQTHDAIVWGAGAEQTSRKAAHSPRLHKPITSELGGVTPILVVPGQWSDRAIAFQARHVASMVVHNASFNCVAGKLLILSKSWEQRSQFLEAVRQQLRQIPPRFAYYPGAQERYQNFLEQYPNAEILGQRAKGCIPWTLIPNVPPRAGEYALTAEAFCGILAEGSLDAADPTDFLGQATQVVNDKVYGTLSCTILIDPQTQRQHQAAFDQAIAQLRYGTIGVNLWSGALFNMPEVPWGAFPGHSLAEIGSGQGTVHNTSLLGNTQKAVVSAPFLTWPTPAWFAQHQTLHKVGRRLIAFEQNPKVQTLAAVIAAAVMG
ncbi:MAG: aldehyde dehydrogenase family protein [Thermosynechococcaceae cyanobacterium MS004]|nr:aldehyde dehydrogenase family protein [Thermosynechococcaceae cyanobacterium MS004]